MSDFEELATLLRTIRFSVERVREFDSAEACVEFLASEEVVADATRLMALLGRVDEAHDCGHRTLLSAFLFHAFPQQAEGANPCTALMMEAGAAVIARFERMRDVAAAGGSLRTVTDGAVECLVHFRDCVRGWRDYEKLRLYAALALLEEHRAAMFLN